MKAEFQRKRTRLGASNYIGRRWYFVTICCFQRKKFFASPKQAQWLIACLRREAGRNNFAVHAFCVMPDHVHFLTEGLLDQSNLQQFVSSLKRGTAWEIKKSTGSRLWQRFFYDHIVRKAEDADAIAWYIWMNPVRKGLCLRPELYRFSGTFTGTPAWSRKPQEEWVPPWKRTVADMKSASTGT